jgi:hypothetical protein
MTAWLCDRSSSIYVSLVLKMDAETGAVRPRDTNINYFIAVHARKPGTSIFWDDLLKLLEDARAPVVIFNACRASCSCRRKDTSQALVPVSRHVHRRPALRDARPQIAERGESLMRRRLPLSWPNPAPITSAYSKMSKELCTRRAVAPSNPWESNGLLRRSVSPASNRYWASHKFPVTSERLSEAAEVGQNQGRNTYSVLEAFAVRYDCEIGSAAHRHPARQVLEPTRSTRFSSRSGPILASHAISGAPPSI